jgi:hypothetical protein
MWIRTRIQLFTLMRIWIQEVKTVRIRILVRLCLHKNVDFGSVADPDPGSGIRDWVLFDPWIRDPE